MRRLANVIRGRQAVALSPVTLELHGLSRYADYPRSVDRDGNVRRLPQAIALRRPDVDLADAITVWAALTLKAPETRYKAADGLPMPNWVVTTDRGQAYPTWCLFWPVAKHENARARPAEYLAWIAAAFAAKVGADPLFDGLAPNPLIDAPGRRVEWLGRQGHELRGMAAAVPGWRREARFDPTTAVTVQERDNLVFRHIMEFAGSERTAPLLPVAQAANLRLLAPLDDAAIGRIADNVERYRRGWIERGWHKESFRRRQADRGRKGGEASGRARRAATGDRDADIIADWNAGLSQRKIAAKHGVSRGAVTRIIRRAGGVDSEANTVLRKGDSSYKNFNEKGTDPRRRDPPRTPDLWDAAAWREERDRRAAEADARRERLRKERHDAEVGDLDRAIAEGLRIADAMKAGDRP